MRARPAAPLFLSLAALVALPLALAGCSMLDPLLLPKGKIQGVLPPPAPGPAGTGEFQVGAARVDLTPIPGVPMAYSLDGKVSRGAWTRLYARAIYLEDGNGQALALVSCELPHIPNGFGDRVAEIVGGTPATAHLGRARIVLAATHTHHSPQNFFSDKYYNSLPSPRSGFDPELFEFLARRVAAAIVEAHQGRQTSAGLRYRETTLDLFFRNRSFPAFLRNPESAAFLDASAASGSCELADLPDVPEHPEGGGACRAVRASVETIEFVAGDGSPIASASFLAAHPTVLSSQSEVYSGDLFGVAATLLEQQRLGACGGYEFPVVALFNGAQGDVSATWERRDRVELLNTDTSSGRRLGLAVQLAEAICQQPSTPPALVKPTLEFQFAWLSLKESLNAGNAGPEACEPWNERCTAAEPISGAAAMGGAQDGRTIWYEMGMRDELRSAARGPHGRKAAGIDASGSPIEISKMLTGSATPPEEIPLGVYRVGAIVIATLPGEFTTMLGERIRNGIDELMPPDPQRHVVLIGLANGRVSYVTTAEEYDAQFYEGGQNLYGAATGPMIQSRLAGLAGKAGSAGERVGPYRYEPGLCRVFLPRDAGFPAYHADDGLQNVLEDMKHPDRTKRDFPMQCWVDAIPRLPDGSNACRRAVPYVWVEPRNTADPAAQCTRMFVPQSKLERFAERPCDAPLDGQCTSGDPRTCAAGVPQDNCGLELVTVLQGSYLDRTRWCAWWMPPEGVVPEDQVLCVAGVTGENVRQAGGLVDGDSELLDPQGHPEAIDSGPDTWLGRLLMRHAECCGHPTRPVCEYPELGP